MNSDTVVAIATTKRRMAKMTFANESQIRKATDRIGVWLTSTTTHHDGRCPTVGRIPLIIVPVEFKLNGIPR
jgi:hypothetical protein